MYIPFNSPLFWGWFSINNNTSTRYTTEISQNDFFDTGTPIQLLTLYRRSYKKDSYGAKMVQVLGPILWNDLPGSLRDSDSVIIFKKGLIKLLLSKYDE